MFVLQAATFRNQILSEHDTSQFLMIIQCNHTAQLRSIRTTQKMFGSERASPGRATVFRSETESTSPSMVARHGRTSVWTSRNGSRESQLVRKTATRFLPRCLVRYGAIRPIAAFTKLLTEARHGRKFSKVRIFPPGALISRSIRRIRT